MLKNLIKRIIRENLNEQTNSVVDRILDKINTHGKESLSYDELTFLKQHSSGNIDKNLEVWLLDDSDETFDSEGVKLLYDEFEENEDIFYNKNKLKRIISKHLNKKPFTNNADWGGGLVWNIKSNDNYVGLFLYLGDDDLVLMKRTLNDDEYNDEIIKNIFNSTELYNSLSQIKKIF
jgi:hypothetical protein